MLSIRLQRIGKKKQPSYRFIVSEKNRDTQYGSTEILGSFNPFAKENMYVLKRDRIEYWLSKGAQPSDTVHNILVSEGIIKEKKRAVVTISKIRRGKMDAKAAEVEKVKEQAKAKAEAEAKAQAEAAAAAAAAAATPAPAEESAPAEEEAPAA